MAMKRKKRKKRPGPTAPTPTPGQGGLSFEEAQGSATRVLPVPWRGSGDDLIPGELGDLDQRWFLMGPIACVKAAFIPWRHAVKITQWVKATSGTSGHVSFYANETRSLAFLLSLRESLEAFRGLADRDPTVRRGPLFTGPPLACRRLNVLPGESICLAEFSLAGLDAESLWKPDGVDLEFSALTNTIRMQTLFTATKEQCRRYVLESNLIHSQAQALVCSVERAIADLERYGLSVHRVREL